jgi:hypothetical protein
MECPSADQSNQYLTEPSAAHPPSFSMNCRLALLPFRLKHSRIVTRSFSAFSARMTPASASAISWKTAPYPAARREEHYDEYTSKASGVVKVHDPYRSVHGSALRTTLCLRRALAIDRWLETPPSESEETKAFVEAQADYTNQYLTRDPNRQKLKAALTSNWNYARCELMSRRSLDLVPNLMRFQSLVLA